MFEWPSGKTTGGEVRVRRADKLWGDIQPTDLIANIQPIDAGGTAEVFRATLLAPNQLGITTAMPVALKEIDIDPAALGDTSERRDFRNDQISDEYVILRELNQYGVGPHVFGMTQRTENKRARISLVMEFIEGPTLHEEIITGHRFNLGEVRHVGEALLSNLDVAHSKLEAGVVVHRDIKPGNIKIKNGRRNDDVRNGSVVLLDWGSAVKPRELPTYTRDERTMGTSIYRAPEQFFDPAYRNDISPQTDLYAVALVLSELILGKPREIFLAEYLRMTVDDLNKPEGDGKIGDAIKSPHYLVYMMESLMKAFIARGVDNAVADRYIKWLMHAFQPDPRHRYQSAQEMFAAMPQVA